MVENITPIVNSNVVNGSEILEKRFSEVKDKQGVLGSVWNDFKETFGCGVSKVDCRTMLDRYNNGEISFDEAIEYINDYEKKQDSMSELGANILTGVGAIAAATCAISGPIGWLAAFTVGAPVGALLKTGIKCADRATNNIKNDEFDSKQMLKDAISGAVTGAASAVSSGVGVGIKAGKMSLSISNGTKCGAQCGALAGASSYITDVALDDNKYFSLKDFAKTTLTSAFVSGTVGAVVGAGMYKMSGNVGQDVSKTLKQTIVDDSLASSSRKVLGQAERTIMAIG